MYWLFVLNLLGLLYCHHHHQELISSMCTTHFMHTICIHYKNLKRFNSDALITNLKGTALGVVTADCVPILLYDIKNKKGYLFDLQNMKAIK